MLADDKKQYLYQTRPDIFPEGFETQTERELWGLFWEDKNNKMNAARAKADMEAEMNKMRAR